jgi:hypothetical protein
MNGVLEPAEAFFSACGFPATALKERHILPERGQLSWNCLECAAIFRHPTVDGAVPT